MADQFLKHNQLALRALWLLERAVKRQSVRKIRAACRAFERVLTVMSPDHPDRPACLANLAAALRLLYERTGDPAAIDALLRLHNTLVDFLPEHHPNRVSYRGNVRSLVARLAADEGTPPDLLSRLVPLAREAALDAATREACLFVLRVCLRCHLELAPDDDVSTELAAVVREQISALSSRAPARDPSVLAGLGADLREAALVTGPMHFLDEALATGRRAVELCPPDGRERATCLAMLSNTLHARFVHQDGSLDTLRESVAVARAAIAVAPAGGEHHPSSLLALGIALRELYEATRDLDPLKEAFAACRQALSAVGPGHPNRAPYLTNLSAAGQELYKRTGNREAIALAASCAAEAVRLSPPGSLTWAGRMTELGNVQNIMLAGPGVTAGDAAHALAEEEISEEAHARRLAEAHALLQRSVDTAREAVRAGGRNAFRDGPLTNLSIAARVFFEITGDTTALDEAVQAAREAVTLAKPETRAYQDARVTLIRALARCALTPDTAAEMRDRCAELAASAVAPRAHVAAHFHYAEALMSADEPDAESALAAYEAAIARLPEIAARRLLRPDREHNLAEFGGLASGAAAAALSLGRPERALLLLEHARGLLLREAMGHHGAEAHRLRSAAPELAEEWARLQRLLSASDQDSADLYHDGVVASGRSGRLDRHQALAERRERLLADIRAIPGLESFQQPPSFEELRRRTPQGPVVMLNAGHVRCDALILDMEGTVRSLRLDCDYDELDRCAEVFKSPGPRTPKPPKSTAQDEQPLLDALARLWDHVVEPVLAELDLLSPVPVPEATAPRVWWCPVGVASFLPLHAAGRYGDLAPSAPSAAMDHVVSSYTSTLNALPPRREAAAPNTGTASAGLPSVLLVEAGRVPGAVPLPGARAEIQRLRELIPNSTLLSGRGATRDTVLSSLPAHRMAHLACHAVTDPRSPALNRLLLHDHASAPLTSLELAGVSVPDGELAYLSACETSRASRALADEALHIACAFQMAGYRHVIGTLWRITDSAAGRIADDFYTGLAPSFRSDEAARSLHRAVNGLRSDAPLQPSCWAAHVHLGS
ncbi:CHAT domain-containing protein [Streptomyces xinghaiensis]|uniref:CHAT domain-containing protein n=1 Tax=Streptomyces xinghaiensis TaxID=1038928 RepID=UPI0002E687C9|nr:CHAT domain-containing protein [Streptomyces xinghaiensis]MZE78610.1 CHAT domain-containing protein [Streptomyces sp. SID5475]